MEDKHQKKMPYRINLHSLSPLHKIILPVTESATKNCRKCRFFSCFSGLGRIDFAEYLHDRTGKKNGAENG